MAASDAAEKEQEKESDEDEESIEAEMMNVDWEVCLANGLPICPAFLCYHVSVACFTAI